jgi:ATP-binding cassette subfamily B protein
MPAGGAICMKDIDFAYGNGPLVLRGFTLEIPAGQRVGIVGPSGAGKSTVLGLLQRLDDVPRGTVTIDGQDVKDVRQDSLRASIAVVPQDVTLMHRSVMENVRYGRPDADDEDVRRAADDACCDEFIEALPDGIKTMVGERGARLSGGQRQRVSIARAFLKRAPILLLDEATSALDSESENRIQLALDRLMRGRTVVAVAHRLSTLSSFDRIVVIENGKIIEDGRPDDLRLAGGTYERLWRLQAEGRETA